MTKASGSLMSARAPADPGISLHTPHDSRAYLIATSALLLLGGFLFGLGWVLGLFMLWRSTSHSRASKIICTLIWPGGLAAAMATLYIPVSTAPGYFVDLTSTPVAPAVSGWTIVYVCAIFIIPVVTQYLALRNALRKVPPAAGTAA